MRRREFIALIGTSVVWPFSAMAQKPGRTYRLGVLFAGPRRGDVVTAFFEGVRRQGFIEGQNLAVIYHALGMNPDLLPEWVAELVKARVDVIAVAGNSAIRAAQGATKTIPILAITDDMLGTGLVNSLARPNGNTTAQASGARALNVLASAMLWGNRHRLSSLESASSTDQGGRSGGQACLGFDPTA